MQKYLNIDPMDGAGALLESAGLLGAGVDEEAPSVLALQPMNTGMNTGSAVYDSQHGSQHGFAGAAATGTGAGAGAGGMSTTPTGAMNRTPMFGAGAPNTASGYVPPVYGAGSEIHDGGEDGVSNPMSAQAPLGSRYAVPSIPVPSGPAPGSGPPPAASASKNKKAMKEPKSMRSST